ncbi:MAG: hypothetical protein LQ337_006924 [Flavoplaca oasis]|nr:MAG: hypothetical protein LQ337_006924 [Flavoplaca oasis]
MGTSSTRPVDTSHMTGFAEFKAGDKRIADETLEGQPSTRKPKIDGPWLAAQIRRYIDTPLQLRPRSFKTFLANGPLREERPLSPSEGHQEMIQKPEYQTARLQTSKMSTGDQITTHEPPEQPSSGTVTTDTIEEAFLVHDEPIRAPHWSFCTLGQLDKVSKTPWLIGELTEQSNYGYALCVKFDIRSATGPALSLRLLVEITPTGLPFERKNPYDYAEYRWTPSQDTSVDWRTVQCLSYYRFTDWIKDATQEILALPQVVEAMKPENRDKAVVVTCKLHQDSYTDFKFPFSWSKIPWNVAREFQWLARRPLPEFNSFLFIPDDIQDKVKTIPAFRRLVNQ